MEELISYRDGGLPTTINDLSKFVLVGQEKLVSVRAEIRAIEKVGLSKEVRDQKLHEAQDIAEVVLDAETKLGELTSKLPKAKNQYDNAVDTGVHSTKAEAIENAGLTVKQVQRFETLAANPDLVEQAKAEAREKDDVVSRSSVLEKVKQKKRKKLREQRDSAIAEQIERPKTSNHVDIFKTDKKYRVIYADPPWSYNDKQNIEMLGGAEKHYPTMPLKDICDLPVPSEDNAVLFLWVTSPLLEDCFKVIKAWGFKYKSSFVWDKVAHNMGHYNSVRHEFLLVCTKGSCTPDVQKLFDSVVSIERTDHSRKPAEFRTIIDTLYPVGNRLEMFAREAPDGWDVWGNMA